MVRSFPILYILILSLFKVFILGINFPEQRLVKVRTSPVLDPIPPSPPGSRDKN